MECAVAETYLLSELTRNNITQSSGLPFFASAALSFGDSCSSRFDVVDTILHINIVHILILTIWVLTHSAQTPSKLYT